MTKEQEEAIGIIEKMVKSYIEADECGLSNNDFKHEIRAMQTFLSMLKEKSAEIKQKNTELAEKNAEIEKFKQVLARNIARNVTSSMKESAKSKEDLEMLNAGWQIELEKKDKIIDLMAEYIFQNVDVEEDICNSAYVEYTQETAQDITCISCIRQYFEREVNSSEQN